VRREKKYLKKYFTIFRTDYGPITAASFHLDVIHQSLSTAAARLQRTKEESGGIVYGGDVWCGERRVC